MQRRNRPYDIARQRLTTRIDALDRNLNNGNQDDVFQQWQEEAAQQWMVDNEGNGRQVEDEQVYLFISSEMRDRKSWPSSTSFRVTLSEEINNVTKAELIQASLPSLDPTVNLDNNVVRYSFSAHTGASIRDVVIPTGSYTGPQLALEIQTQMNLDWHASLITGGSNTMDFTTGFIVDGVGDLESTIDQFKVQFVKARSIFIFQVVDNDQAPQNAPAFALHFKLAPMGLGDGSLRTQTDDLAKILGFEAERVAEIGTYDSGSDTYYLVNSTVDNEFRPGDVLDARYQYGINSNQFADLRGHLAVVLDIHPFNDTDTARLEDTGTGAVNLQDYFAIILMRDPAFVNDRATEICNNTYPIRRNYREGRERVKELWVTIKRPDGSIADFGNSDFFLTLRITCKRIHAERPMFTR